MSFECGSGHWKFNGFTIMELLRLFINKQKTHDSLDLRCNGIKVHKEYLGQFRSSNYEVRLGQFRLSNYEVRVEVLTHIVTSDPLYCIRRSYILCINKCHMQYQEMRYQEIHSNSILRTIHSSCFILYVYVWDKQVLENHSYARQKSTLVIIWQLESSK